MPNYHRIHPLPYFLIVILTFAFPLFAPTAASTAEWSIPVGGNAFRTAPSPGNGRSERSGTITLDDADEEYSIYFHVDRPAALELDVEARAAEGSSMIVAHVGEQKLRVSIDGTEFALHKIGKVEIPAAGYVRVALQGEQRITQASAELRKLIVSSDTQDLKLAFVKSNDGNMFYWGRRGPSVHLAYVTPKDRSLRYAYNEVTVPKGQDTIGSFFMANGFGEGYFGIQVNGPNERKVLFSVWSPFQTDNPRDIPEDQRVVRVASGEKVRVGEFGNEGAGGQSFLDFAWKPDVTYCFLTEAKPDATSNSTTYTSWLREKEMGQWQLIASFRRPKTQTGLRGFHSFLENFNPAYGHMVRSAYYGNAWVADVDGQWSECTQARFTVDATGRGGHRLDFIGGADGDRFYLRNCGFFSETGKPDEVHSRNSTSAQKPMIDFEGLPR